jgi:hypothetical protein
MSVSSGSTLMVPLRNLVSYEPEEAMYAVAKVQYATVTTSVTIEMGATTMRKGLEGGTSYNYTSGVWRDA